MKCVCESGDGKELENGRELFFFWSWQSAYLYSQLAMSMQSQP